MTRANSITKNALIDPGIEAHGDHERWRQICSLDARVGRRKRCSGSRISPTGSKI
jgi:hypothetical protein